MGISARFTHTLGLGVLLGLSCAESQSGDAQRLRFGHIVRYAEIEDFSAAIAARQEMPLSIQGTTRPALLNDYPYLDGTLTASRKSDGAPVTSIQRTGLGQFKATFPMSGTYVLHAKAGELEDVLDIRVAEQTHLRLARSQRIIATSVPNDSCSADAPDGDFTPDLKSNQSLSASIVPADASGNPLLGVLPLQFFGDDVQVAPTVGPQANSYVFTPKPGRLGTATVTVKDETSGQTLELNFNVLSGEAACPGK